LTFFEKIKNTKVEVDAKFKIQLNVFFFIETFYGHFDSNFLITVKRTINSSLLNL
jgi:hypothetical protein